MTKFKKIAELNEMDTVFVAKRGTKYLARIKMRVLMDNNKWKEFSTAVPMWHAVNSQIRGYSIKDALCAMFPNTDSFEIEVK